MKNKKLSPQDYYLEQLISMNIGLNRKLYGALLDELVRRKKISASYSKQLEDTLI